MNEISPTTPRESTGGAIDRELRDQLAVMIRQSRRETGLWDFVDDALFELHRSGLNAERCGCGYSRGGLGEGRCPECGRVPDIGLNNLLRSMQLMIIDEEDLEHQLGLGPEQKREAREFWSRVVLFLRSDVADAAEVDEPTARKWKWREAVCLAGAVACFPPLNFLLFDPALGILLIPVGFVFWYLSTWGRAVEPEPEGRLADHWPFATAEDFARAKCVPRFLCGA